MLIDTRPLGGATLPAPPPQRRYDQGTYPDGQVYVPGATPESGTSAYPDTIAGLWNARFLQWKTGFEQRIGANVRRYWSLWRNFNTSPNPGPGQEWRDRTVIPQAFKEIATRVPRLVLGLWGVPEPWTVNGRGFSDKTYEEQVRVLMQTLLDEIGTNDPMSEGFLKRQIDGTYYSQIIGHAWWKAFWRTEDHWIRTRIPEMSEDGRTVLRWTPVEVLDTRFDGVDITWLPVSNLAIDLYGRRRWAIELVRTSLESLIGENDRYKEQNGRPLYPGLKDMLNSAGGLGTPTKDSTSEPRDTERWPLDDGTFSQDPNSTSVELWLCWDNVAGTLTKILNRKWVLDGPGLMPTPNLFDPYIGQPAVPIPGLPYGDSIFNWNGGLYTRQTRIARNRMDEALMNIFQQYLMREGSMMPTTWFHRPGGIGLVKQVDDSRPISDSIFLVPRRPLPPEAYQEEAYTQRQSEAVAGADSVSQGVEATNKSRDVSATEITQRVLQGASRFQLEVLYQGVAYQKPLMQNVFDLAQANLTQPRIIRILDDVEGTPIDLRSLQRSVDIVVGNPMEQATQAEKVNELQVITEMSKDPNFAAVFKHRDIAEAVVKSTKTLRREAQRYVRSEEEMAAAQQAAMAAAGGAGTPPGGPAGGAPPGAEGAGGPGAAGPTGSSSVASASRGVEETI